MGQISCKGCNMNSSSSKVEIDFSSLHIDQKDLSPYTSKEIATSDTSESPLVAYSDLRKLVISSIKIQRFWRGYLSQKLYKSYFKDSSAPYHYLKPVEIFETLSSRVYTKIIVFKKFKYFNGGIYTGEWRGGFRDGHGLMIWSDGARYEGEWKYGKPSGKGLWKHIDGDSFYGMWKYPYFVGNAYLIINTGKEIASLKDGYEWLWYKHYQMKANLRSNPTSPKHIELINNLETRLIEIESSLYEIKVSCKPDLCKFRESEEDSANWLIHKFADGSRYIGEWKEGLRDGLGRQIWLNGDIYEGTWKEDKQHGLGRNIWTDGSWYIGSYQSNSKFGLGEYYWEDGTRYIGEWCNNCMEGAGIYTWPDGKCYRGEWLRGFMHGFGILIYSDKRKYEGFWSYGKKHGEAITYLISGRVSKDIWRHGKIIKPDV